MSNTTISYSNTDNSQDTLWKEFSSTGVEATQFEDHVPCGVWQRKFCQPLLSRDSLLGTGVQGLATWELQCWLPAARAALSTSTNEFSATQGLLWAQLRSVSNTREIQSQLLWKTAQNPLLAIGINSSFILKQLKHFKTHIHCHRSNSRHEVNELLLDSEGC